jgi:protein-arginine kinase activator protein McsA
MKLPAKCIFCKQAHRCFEISRVRNDNAVELAYICEPCAGTESFLYVDKQGFVKHNQVERLYKSSFLDDVNYDETSRGDQ